MENNILDEMVTSTKAAKLLGVTTGAIMYWEQKGTLIPKLTAGGHRRYSLRDLKEFAERRKQLKNINNIMELEENATNN